MRLALYHGLIKGGAMNATNMIIDGLRRNHTLEIFENQVGQGLSNKHRFIRDFYCLFIEKENQRKIAEEIDSKKFDAVIVCQDGFMNTPWILRFLKTKSIYVCQEPTRAYFENFLDQSDKLPFLNKIYEKIIREKRKKEEIINAQSANMVLSNSYSSNESIYRAYGTYTKVIYFGVDRKTFFKTKSKRKNKLTIIGNNEPQKGIIDALDILENIPKSIRPELEIIGPRNSNYQEIISRAKRKGIKAIGRSGIKIEDLREAYSTSIATLAIAHLETFGLSVIESMSCGTPVIAVREGGYRDIILDDKSGFLVDRDPKLLANKVVQLIKDPKLVEEMGQSGIKYVEKRFSPEVTYSLMEQYINDVTNS